MKGTNIIIFGDSITYGACDYEMGGWVNRLRIYFDNNAESKISVFNLGISGEISEEVLTRFDSEFNARYDKDKKNVVIFAIGSRGLKGRRKEC